MGPGGTHSLWSTGEGALVKWRQGYTAAFQERRRHEPKKDRGVVCGRNTGPWAKPLRWVRPEGRRLRLENREETRGKLGFSL